MKKIFKILFAMEKRKLGKILFAAGMVLLIISAILMIATDSIFSSVILFFSILCNVTGLYIIMWEKGKGEKNDKR